MLYRRPRLGPLTDRPLELKLFVKAKTSKGRGPIENISAFQEKEFARDKKNPDEHIYSGYTVVQDT